VVVLDDASFGAATESRHAFKPSLLWPGLVLALVVRHGGEAGHEKNREIPWRQSLGKA
jgi:hypothetical protein